MKKRKLLRNVSLVALSAVLVGGTAMAFTACGGGDENTISVYIFCNASDATTNELICKNWAERYGEQIGRELTIDFRYNESDSEYFNDIGTRLSQQINVPDVMYIAPSSLRSNVMTGRLLDLSEYLLKSETGVQGATSIWEASLAFYGVYQDGNTWSNARTVEYREATDTVEAGFYDGEHKVGIYGLPKDYSNFSMGYNRVFFTDEMKQAYTTKLATQGREVISHKYTDSNLNNAQTLTHRGGATMEGAITYACDVENYDNPYTAEKETINAKAGDDAPIINIGIPTAYKPFNFYWYSNYDDALDAGDPIAVQTEYHTNGAGFVVTIPGFPGEKYDISGEEYAKYKDPNAIYDTDSAYVTFTYAEYGALSWAVCYYLNTFAWDNDQNLLSGQGGRYYTDSQRYQNIYAGEQYENGFGANGYVLPWLYSNDAAYINDASDDAQNNDNNTGSWSDPNVKTWVGKNSETIQKMTLDGGTRDAKVQYGMDSENFIETYGAFHNHGSLWNGNAGNAGDGYSSNKTGSGWDYFRAGAAVFYGAGTWDSATRNNVDADTLSVGQIPSPVSEKLALYSTVRNAYYDKDVDVYANDTKKEKGVGNDAGTATDNSGDYAQAADPEARVFTQDEIIMNQLKRQDKWGGRMDSVGYSANGALANNEWKAEAVANLIMELTINEDAQLTLTYGGAQLPNVKQQCIEFLNYQEEGYADGAFKDMITPDGDAAGNDVWDQYYTIVRDMAAAARGGETKTVQAYLADKQITLDDGSKVPVSYDPQYANVALNAFTPGDGETYIAYSMRVLRMINLTKIDRDLNIRMQYGLNSARDQLMYTPGETWIAALEQSAAGNMLAYINAGVATTMILFEEDVYPGNVATQMDQIADTKTHPYMSPAVLCIRQVTVAQDRLERGV